jgi:SAM-dependent methyltransferase
MADPTQRFSSRVADYVKYRPSYPSAVFDTIARECALAPGAAITDIGSGTGISAEPFLRRGYRVYGVEPNEAMRSAAEGLLAGYPAFVALPGRAEETGLPSGSVALVFAAQAFHWFDRARARAEFQRILEPGGFVALVWNERERDRTPFLVDYERLLREHATDYAPVNHRDQAPREVVAEFFAPVVCQSAAFPNHQDLDLDGLIGRSRSSSYVPEPGHPQHDVFYADLARIYGEYAVSGSVRFEYTTRLYWGRLE